MKPTLSDFRKLVAAKLDAAGFEDLAILVGDVGCEDALSEPLVRAWDDLADGDTEYNAASLHDALLDVAGEFNNGWNFGPGEAPAKVDAQAVARVAASIFGGVDPGVARRNDEARACALLHPERPRINQAPKVRPWLPVLEAAGLVELTRRGWRLTGAGRERALEARCQECATCQEWMLTTDQAGPCEAVEPPGRPS